MSRPRRHERSTGFTCSWSRIIQRSLHLRKRQSDAGSARGHLAGGRCGTAACTPSIKLAPPAAARSSSRCGFGAEQAEAFVRRAESFFCSLRCNHHARDRCRFAFAANAFGCAGATRSQMRRWIPRNKSRGLTIRGENPKSSRRLSIMWRLTDLTALGRTSECFRPACRHGLKETPTNTARSVAVSGNE